MSNEKLLSIINDHRKNREFWRIVRNRNMKYKRMNYIVDDESAIEYYSKLYKKNDNKTILNDLNYNKLNDRIVDKISNNEILIALNCCANSKYPGIDDVSIEMIKYKRTILIDVLNMIFNKILFE